MTERERIYCANPACNREARGDDYCSRRCFETVRGVGDWLTPEQHAKHKRQVRAARKKAGGKTHVDVKNPDALAHRVRGGIGQDARRTTGAR